MGFWLKLAVTFALGIFVLGIWDVLFNFEDNRCQMTYMFEYPDYTRIKLSRATEEQYPHYGLYVYGEGARAQQYHHRHFTGIPVLFIPGNAGSYRQARSLGSILLRMSEKQQQRPVFDVFTIDFNEELAGLYGQFLSEQTDFAVRCSQRILELYSGRHQSIVLVGHSVGGLIARAMFVSPSFNISMAHTIFTLSTPHRPVVVPDEELQEFYDAVNEYWMRSIDQTLSDVVILSLAGGHRDVLIRSERSNLGGLVRNHPRVLSTTTTAVPGVWASTDHLCIVWCKQLLIAQGKALFEMVDPGSQKITTNVKRRIGILRKYFINPTTKILDAKRDSVRQLAPLEPATGPKLYLEAKKSEKAYWQLYSTESSNVSLVIQSSFWNDHWIRACTLPNCDESLILTIQPTRIPWFSDSPHFFAIIPPKTSVQYSALAVEVPRLTDGHYIRAEPVRAPLKVSFSSSLTFPVFHIKRQAYQRFSVQLTEIWEAVNIHVHSKAGCRGLLRFTVPGFAQDTYRLLDSGNTRFALKLQSASVTPGTLELFMTPACEHRVAFSPAWLDMLGQLVRFYALKLPVFFAAVVMVKTVGLYREKVTFWDHSFVSGLAGLIIWVHRAAGLGGPLSEMEGLSGMSGWELWLAFYAISWCLVDVMETVIRLVVTMYSWPVYWLAHPTVVRLQSMGDRLHWGFSARHLIFPIFVGVTSAAAYLSCGENGIILSVILYFLRVCYDKRHLQRTSSSSLGGMRGDVREETQIILLALLTALLNVVPSVVWSRRISLSSGWQLWESVRRNQLDSDPSFVVALLLGSMLDLSGIHRKPLTDNSEKRGFRHCFRRVTESVLLAVVYACSAFSLALAQDYLYMLERFLSVLLASVSLGCLAKLLTKA